MKKKFIFLSLIFFTAYILFFPKDAVNAAANGLMLWYEKVLPTLLPFAVLSNILIDSNYLQYLNRILAPLLCRLLPVSDNGAFVLLSGFLFGFPMGSKNCAQLLKNGGITRQEADVLFVITNNISPVFISSYILQQQLHMTKMTLISYLILFVPPLVLGFVRLRRQVPKQSSLHSQTVQTVQTAPYLHKKPASGSQMNFKIIDAGIMNGFETLTRLGGYIMLFSMLSSILPKLPLPEIFGICLTGITEITNGIALLGNSELSSGLRYILAMAFTAFGGLSGIAQTSAMVKDTGLSIKSYCIQKLLLGAVSAALACAAVICLGI